MVVEEENELTQQNEEVSPDKPQELPPPGQESEDDEQSDDDKVVAFVRRLRRAGCFETGKLSSDVAMQKRTAAIEAAKVKHGVVLCLEPRSNEAPERSEALDLRLMQEGVEAGDLPHVYDLYWRLVDGALVVLRRPTLEETIAFVAKSAVAQAATDEDGPKDVLDDGGDEMLDCVVYPDEEAARAIFTRFNLMIDTLGRQMFLQFAWLDSGQLKALRGKERKDVIRSVLKPEQIKMWGGLESLAVFRLEGVEQPIICRDINPTERKLNERERRGKKGHRALFDLGAAVTISPPQLGNLPATRPGLPFIIVQKMMERIAGVAEARIAK